MSLESVEVVAKSMAVRIAAMLLARSKGWVRRRGSLSGGSVDFEEARRTVPVDWGFMPKIAMVMSGRSCQLT